MEAKKNSMMPLVVLAALFVLSLPLFYLLVSRVMLPLLWDEPQYQEPVVEETSPATD